MAKVGDLAKRPRLVDGDDADDDDNIFLDGCDVCGGSLRVVGFGDCPKCVGTERSLASASNAASGNCSAIDVDTPKSCELCLGAKRVRGLGQCPLCTAQQDVASSQQHLDPDRQLAAALSITAKDEERMIVSDRKMAEAILAEERETQARSELQTKLDRTLADVLSKEEQHEAQLKALSSELDEARTRASSGVSDAWHRLATLDEDVSDETKLPAFFHRRQQGQRAFTIEWCSRVENCRLDAFTAGQGSRPTLLFHGTPERNVGNIMAAGLLMEFCGGCGGIFGAMNPQTSLGYSQKSGDQRHFMAVAVYDLPLAGAGVQEGAAYSVPKDDAVAVLWLLKISKMT
mmetsp:Transcript_74497/g.241866  ORF Transcript_74497/g.241866 Transcript_74497/m.241866 type:complete len:345 (-) Transcript_74497:64-1098(-)